MVDSLNKHMQYVIIRSKRSNISRNTPYIETFKKISFQYLFKSYLQMRKLTTFEPPWGGDRVFKFQVGRYVLLYYFERYF